MGRLLRSKVAIVCLAALIALGGVCSPRVRAFAAAKLSGIHSTHTTALTQSGPIPYILDLSKRKPHRKAALQPAAKKAAAKAPKKPPAPPAR
ncbi:MAG: hypothetical protein ACM3NQ_22380 [Bacteroidales bacterium]